MMEHNETTRSHGDATHGDVGRPSTTQKKPGGSWKDLSPEERTARNLALLQQPEAQVLLPRTMETRLLTRMLYPLNRAVSRLRSNAGMAMPVAAVMVHLEALRAWVDAVTDYFKASGAELVLQSDFLVRQTLEERQRRATARGGFVIVPQTEEVKLIVLQIMRLDEVLLNQRLATANLLAASKGFAEVERLVRQLHELTEAVCVPTRIKYQAPRQMPAKAEDGAAVATTPR